MFTLHTLELVSFYSSSSLCAQCVPLLPDPQCFTVWCAAIPGILVAQCAQCVPQLPDPQCFTVWCAAIPGIDLTVWYTLFITTPHLTSKSHITYYW